PFLIPPIYPGVRFIVYCILEKGIEACKEIILSANSHDGPMKLLIPLDPVTLQGSKIHTLAARKLIQELDDGNSLIHKHQRNNGKPIPISLIREQIVKLGITYNLISKYTSFLAIDERDNKVVAEAQSFPKIVPTRSDEPIFYKKKKSSRQLDSFLSSSDSYIGSSYKRPTQSCSSTISYYNAVESFSISSSEEPAILATSVKMKPPKIETLYSFLNFQSFDGSFLPSEKYYSWFGKNDFKDFEIIRIKNER
ncbi:18354_t:CDS:2, partial [Gigaspora rosea]